MSVLSKWQLQQPTTKYAQVIALLTLMWIALPLMQQLPIGVSVLFGMLMLLRVSLTMLGIGGLPTWANIVLMLVAAAAVYGQLNTLFGQEGGVSLLLLMAVIKSFEGKTTRDWQVLLVTALFLVAGGLLFQQSLYMGMWLVCALVLIFISLSLLNGMRWRFAWRNTLLALGLSLPMMLVLFLMVPRFSEPLWRLPAQKHTTKTGLSTELTMGDMSQVIESNELAFNVAFESGPIPKKSQLYWRAMVMNDFDGHTWRAHTQYTLLQDAYSEQAGNKTVYSMTLQDFQGHIPALEQVLQVDNSLVLRENQVVFAKRSYGQLRKVQLESVLSERIHQRLDDSKQRQWLRLPPRKNPQTLALAKSWQEQYQGNERAIVDAALAHFRTQGYAYSLSPGALQQDGNQIDQFLFQSKVGFCEHYASSFVVLMRAAGIPARVVTGYLGGSFNETAHFWQVRGKDAHAWTEVWLSEQQAWVRIDPTSVVSQTRITDGINAALPEQMNSVESVLPQSMQNWLASSQYYWQQWVVNYDAEHQHALFQRLNVGALTVTKWVLIASLLLCITVLPIIMWWRRQYRQRIDPLSSGFLLLKAAYLGEDSDQYRYWGAQQLQQHLHQNKALSSQMNALLEQYKQFRYGAHEPTVAEQWQWYKQVKKALKSQQE